MDLTLYYSPGACSMAAHIILEEGSFEFTPRATPINEKATRSDEYLAMNPLGFVPVLAIDGEYLTELPAILAYLATLRPSLAPAPGSLPHARCLEWLAWMSSSFHVKYAQLFRPERFLPEGPERAVLTRHALTFLARCNERVNDRLAGPWVLGERFSIVDAYIFPFFRWGARSGFDMTALYPRWASHTQAMLGLSSVQRAVSREGLAMEEWTVPAPGRA